MMTHKLISLIYRYRDAGNFKVEGELCLAGNISVEKKALFIGLLIDHEWFVPEQVGLRPLQSELFVYSGGPTTADHALHEFVDFLPWEFKAPMGSINFLSIEDLIVRFKIASKRWDVSLSPYA